MYPVAYRLLKGLNHTVSSTEFLDCAHYLVL
jgi:hypothetical protein